MTLKRECSELAVTTIPFAGKRVLCRALNVSPARCDRHVILCDGRGAALTRSAALNAPRPIAARGTPESQERIHNTVKAKRLMLSKEMF